MPWNSTIQQEYLEMLAGSMGQALDLPDSITFPPSNAIFFILMYAHKLEIGEYEDLRIEPDNQTYLTHGEMRFLHLMRAACCMYIERKKIFPWRLRDKKVSDLRPLLSIHYQGLRKEGSDYYFHRVWDVNPGQRTVDAILDYLFLGILEALGVIDELPTTETQFICFLIQNMRDSGWQHMIGWYEEYAGYPDHGSGTYDYEIIREVKRSGCHTMSGYLVSTLRSYNIVSHIGRGWGDGPQPASNDLYYRLIHKNGHCFIHLSSIGEWLAHGDDIYNEYLKTIPPEFAFKSYSWMSTYHFDTTEYEYKRAEAYINIFWWCFLLGESDSPWYDVRFLYNNGYLRNSLETLHEEYDLANLDGAPANVPPVFDDNMVNFLMDWVEKKIQAEQNP